VIHALWLCSLASIVSTARASSSETPGSLTSREREVFEHSGQMIVYAARRERAVEAVEAVGHGGGVRMGADRALQPRQLCPGARPSIRSRAVAAVRSSRRASSAESHHGCR
jgi:hypothetical protein